MIFFSAPQESVPEGEYCCAMGKGETVPLGRGRGKGKEESLFLSPFPFSLRLRRFV
ncbi:MAG: hypothetical protein ACFB4I_12005 [Cyanophyceae cyanobacterium]